jgi:tRNA pseudouridine38-40 synthase
MPRYKITVEYDGTSYAGWQKQKQQPSIQGEIERALSEFLQEKVEIYGSGRTDSGVHALGQVAHFDLPKEYSEDTIIKAVNFYLKSQPISILSCEQVNLEFHARFSAKKRYYCYHIINRLSPLTVDLNRAWHIIERLDIQQMQKAAEMLEGTHDFSSFRTSLCQAKSPIKILDYIKITCKKDKITFEIRAQSFLHNMVRNIIGVLRMVGNGKWSLADLQKHLDAKDTSIRKPTAPAHGLYLWKVDF